MRTEKLSRSSRLRDLLAVTASGEALQASPRRGQECNEVVHSRSVSSAASVVKSVLSPLLREARRMILHIDAPAFRTRSGALSITSPATCCPAAMARSVSNAPSVKRRASPPRAMADRSTPSSCSIKCSNSCPRSSLMSEALRISIWASRPPVCVWRNAVRARDVPVGCPYEIVTVARRCGAAARVRHCWRKRGECSSTHFTIGCSPCSSSIDPGNASVGASHVVMAVEAAGATACLFVSDGALIKTNVEATNAASE